MKPESLVRTRWIPQEVGWQIAFRNPEVDCSACGRQHEADLCPYLPAEEYVDCRTARGLDSSLEFQRLEREFNCMAQVTPFPGLALVGCNGSPHQV